MDIQEIITEIEDRITNAWNWENYDVHFELTNLLEWIRESKEDIPVDFTKYKININRK